MKTKININSYKYDVVKKIKDADMYPLDPIFLNILDVDPPIFPIVLELNDQEFANILQILGYMCYKSDDEFTRKIAGNWFVEIYKIPKVSFDPRINEKHTL